MSVVLVISGPAGVGKTTICNQLLKDFKNTLSRVVTSTTRIPRSEEIDGVDYHFLKEKSFVEKLNNGEFLEHEIIHGNYYGTQKESVYSILKTNRDILLNIDVQGAKSLRNEICSDPRFNGILKSIFLKPKDLKILEERLFKRGSDDVDSVSKRLATAKVELTLTKDFDHTLISSSKESDYNSVREIYLKYSPQNFVS